ncbi:MAG: hypothetical protein HQ595_02770 [Candidatus Omnitrophica bacterium]|nr:hypothetical protein [Candidatus Omnitrophota bacterium]
MKNSVLLLVMGSLLVFFTADPVLAQDSALNQLERMAGRTAGSVPDVPSPTCARCRGKGGHHYAWCPYAGRSGARARRRAVPWGTTGLSSSEQFAAQAFSSLLGSLMQDLMAPPPQLDTSYQQQLRKQQQEAEAARIKQKELERQKSLQQWQEFQDKKISERAMERAEKEKQNRELLAKMQTLGSEEPLRMESMAGGKLEPFMWEKREEELELQALWSNPNVVDLSDKKVDTPILLRPASEKETALGDVITAEDREHQKIAQLSSISYGQSQNFNMQNEEQLQEEAEKKPTIVYLGDYIPDKLKEGAIELANTKAPGIKDYSGKIGDAISTLEIGGWVKDGKYDKATASVIKLAVGKLVSGTGNIALQGGRIYSEFTKRVADKAFDSIHEFGKEFGFKSPTGQELRDEMRESESFEVRVTMILLRW